MKKTLFFLASLLPALAYGQVPRKVIVEHFTNTHCSVCASRNPGFYNNLWHYPQVLHIAYHPSAPYVACPLSQHNKPEADARTNFYGVYGSTPRLVIQGAVIDGGANYSDSTLITSELGLTSAFELTTELMASSAANGTVRVVVRKVAASGLTALNLYAVIAEDTLFFTAANGETKHYDVFRKAVWDDAPMSITVPVSVGDSVVYTQNISLHSAWNIGRIYALAILQDATKQVIQAGRSEHLPATLSVTDVTRSITVYPVPATGVLHIDGVGKAKYQITDLQGSVLGNGTASGSVNVSALSTGMYLLRLQDDESAYTIQFVKE